MKNQIRVENLSRSFSGKTVLNGISLTFEEGTINTIIAPNGVGKTTLLSVIADFVAPDQGSVIYEGACEKRNTVFLLPGERNLYMKNTVRENVLFFSVLSGMTKQQAEERLEACRKLFPLYDEIRNKVIEQLSYGQKRLVSILSAVVMDAKCIMIDEASEGLDLANSEALKNILRAIRKGRIIILASQDYTFTADLSDHLYFLKDGKIAESRGKMTQEDFVALYRSLYMDGAQK
jgi:ABC-type multidrug transport system ATPase subunit